MRTKKGVGRFSSYRLSEYWTSVGIRDEYLHKNKDLKIGTLKALMKIAELAEKDL